MGRGRPQYAVVKLPPAADIGTLFMILFENGYSEFKLVNDLSEACGCKGPPNDLTCLEGLEGDTDSEPRPSPSTSRKDKEKRSNDEVIIQNIRGLEEVDDVSEMACSSLRSLPSLMQHLTADVKPSTLVEIPQPTQRPTLDLNNTIVKIEPSSTRLNTSTTSFLDESIEATLNASAGSECVVEEDHSVQPMGPNLAQIVSALFQQPSTSLIKDSDDNNLISFLDKDVLQREKEKQWVLSDIGEFQDLMRRSPTDQRLKKNSEWTYKGEWKCKKCGSHVNPKHRTAQKLLRHLVSHGPRAWSCSACDSKFGLHTSFVSHNKSVHNGEAIPQSLRTPELESVWFDLAEECFPAFVEQIHSCIKKTTHV